MKFILLSFLFIIFILFIQINESYATSSTIYFGDSNRTYVSIPDYVVGKINNQTYVSSGLNGSVLYMDSDSANSINYAVSQGGTTDIKNNTYFITSTILLDKNNTFLDLDKNAKLIRDPSFAISNTTLVNITASNIKIKGGIIDENNLNFSKYGWAILVSGNQIDISETEIKNMKSEDSCITTRPIASNIDISKINCHDNTIAHGFQILGKNITVKDSIASNIAQDCYRTYVPASGVIITNSYAINCGHFGFHSWDSTARTVIFDSDISIGAGINGFDLAGIGTVLSNSDSINSTNYALKVSGGLDLISNFRTKGTGNTTATILIKGSGGSGNNIILNGISGEEKGIFGIDISSVSGTKIFGSYINGVSKQVNDLGIGTTILGSGSISKINTDLDLSNHILQNVTTIKQSGVIASSGFLRIANNNAIAWRNSGNTADCGIFYDSTNVLRLCLGSITRLPSTTIIGDDGSTYGIIQSLKTNSGDGFRFMTNDNTGIQKTRLSIGASSPQGSGYIQIADPIKLGLSSLYTQGNGNATLGNNCPAINCSKPAGYEIQLLPNGTKIYTPFWK